MTDPRTALEALEAKAEEHRRAAEKVALSGEDWRFSNGYAAAVRDLRAALATPPATEERCGWTDGTLVCPFPTIEAFHVGPESCENRLTGYHGEIETCHAFVPTPPAPKPSAALVEAVVNARCVSFPKCDPGAARSVHDPRCIAARSALRADLDAIVTAARAEGLDAAWAEVERLLPEGWWLGGVQRYGGRWAAAAWGPAPEWPRCHAEADDPIIALRNLALALAARRTPEVE